MTTLQTVFSDYQHVLGLQTDDTLNHPGALKPDAIRLDPGDSGARLCAESLLLRTAEGVSSTHGIRPQAIFQPHYTPSHVPQIRYACSRASLFRWLTLLSQNPRVRVVHGVLLEWHNTGILLQGQAGIGKSTLALALLAQGASLVCDDAPYLLTFGSICIGLCPPKLEGLLHSRQAGLINITKWQRDATVQLRVTLQAVQYPSQARCADGIPQVILPARHPALVPWIETIISHLHPQKAAITSIL